MSTDVKPPDMSLNPFVRAARAWSRFWFHPADPTPLGLIRIVAGFLTFYVALAYTVDLYELLGPNAWVDATMMHAYRYEFPFRTPPSTWDYRPEQPRNEDEQKYIEKYGVNKRQAWAVGMDIWSIWFHVTDPTMMMIVHCVILTIMFLFTIGFCTRITSILTWLGMISYTQRAPTTVFGMDTMMNLLLLYLMIGPSGAALSVDRLIRRYLASRRALKAKRVSADPMPPRPMVSANLALRLIQVNLCIIYLASGLSKLRGGAWWEGTAVWGTMANSEFSPMQNSLFMNSLRFLAGNRPMWELVMTGGVMFTLVTEIGFAFLIWNRHLRWVYLTLAALMHVGIAVFMGLNTFSAFMFAMLLSFVPLMTIQWALGLLGRGAPQLRLELATKERRQVRIAALVRAFDAWNQVEAGESTVKRARDAGVGSSIRSVSTLTPDTGEVRRIAVIDASGASHTGYRFFETVTRSVRLLWPIGVVTWIPGVATLGRSLYPSDDAIKDRMDKPRSAKNTLRGEKVSP